MEEQLSSGGSISALPTGAILSNVYVPGLDGHSSTPPTRADNMSPTGAESHIEHSPLLSHHSSLDATQTIMNSRGSHNSSADFPLHGPFRTAPDAQTLPSLSHLTGIAGQGRGHMLTEPDKNSLSWQGAPYTPSHSPSPSLDIHGSSTGNYSNIGENLQYSSSQCDNFHRVANSGAMRHTTDSANNYGSVQQSYSTAGSGSSLQINRNVANGSLSAFAVNNSLASTGTRTSSLSGATMQVNSSQLTGARYPHHGASSLSGGGWGSVGGR